MTPMGSELLLILQRDSVIRGPSGSKSGNTGVVAATATLTVIPAKPTDPALAAIVAAWPNLPPAIRSGIVAMVTASTVETEVQP